MSTRLLRVAQGLRTTLSHLYLNDVFACYILEDSIREEKIAGETAIPTGVYQLRLNTNGNMNRRYKSKFPEMHKGMIEIARLPNFSWVYIHIGNYHYDTKCCPLTGHYWKKNRRDFMVMESTTAYKLIYPKLLEMVRQGHDQIIIENFDGLNLLGDDLFKKPGV